MTLQELYTRVEGDYQAALKTMMMESLANRMLFKFLEDKTCEKLFAAGQAMNPEALFHEAHTLKGVAANLGLLTMSRLAGEICEEFRPGHSRALSDEEVQSLLQALKDLHEKTLSAIREYQG